MKDLDPLWYFLGIEVASSPKGYFLAQAKYANEVIHHIGLIDTKISDTSIELNGLLLSSTSSFDLVTYANFDWADDVTDHKSTSGFYMFLGDSLISWKSKKQIVVSHVTAKAEYRAMAYATAKIIWFHCLLSDLGVPQCFPTSLYCDNHSANQITHNIVFHERTKHIEIDCHFVRQHLQSASISLPFVSSALQLANFFTKTHIIARF
ncbi:uncharacterized protein LOC114308244 [Camellia sinensis]|uniref:uncharacterized protein LOC114308244 n=1 Tax=Camellia sinensis TaxID=4442 RepID=UPI00103629FC|nr:uncharacterized protein LOC114308244 [Camellia sinensis]